MRYLMYTLASALAVIAGIGLPLQAAVNVQLRQLLGSPLRASFGSFLVGTLLLLVASLFERHPLPAPAELARAPWWVWTGGLLGAYFVLSTVVVVPRLGGAVTFALIVAGQMCASLAIDQFGLFGISPTPATPARLAGATLLIAGVLLVRR